MVDSTPPAAQGELASALTLAGARPTGRWPFTSAGPHCRVGLEAAGHGQTQSRPPRSWSWGCPGHLASTARKAQTGPGTPADGRPSMLCAPPPPAQGQGQASTHIRGRHSEDTVQVLHQLLEGGPLGGHRVPTLPHDHVPVDGTAEAPGPALGNPLRGQGADGQAVGGGGPAPWTGVRKGGHRAQTLTGRVCSWLACPCGDPPSAA